MMEKKGESEIIIFAKMIKKMLDVYEKECEKLGIDRAYYPIRITVWATDDNFKPIMKIIEVSR
jgi:hypothetical protein